MQWKENEWKWKLWELQHEGDFICGPLLWQQNTVCVSSGTSFRPLRFHQTKHICTYEPVLYTVKHFSKQTWLLFNEVNVVDIRWLDTSCWGSTGCICLRVDELNFTLSLVLARIVQSDGGDAHYKEKSTQKEKDNAYDPNVLGNIGWTTKYLKWITTI